MKYLGYNYFAYIILFRVAMIKSNSVASIPGRVDGGPAKKIARTTTRFKI